MWVIFTCYAVAINLYMSFSTINFKPGNLFFFGDSICVGQGVSISQGWVMRVARDIDQYNKCSDQNVLVINASRNGDTTRQALERMPYEVQSHGMSYIIIQFGLNDCNYWKSDNGLPRVSLTAFKANIEEIIARSLNFGANKIILNTNHPTLVDARNNMSLSYEDNNMRYNDGIREVAKKMDKDRIAVLDIEVIFKKMISENDCNLSQLLMPDGLHLSLEGHNIYYKSAVEKISNFFGIMKHITT